MVRFLPALLVLILIFGVKPLQFLLILAIVALGLLRGWLPLCAACCGPKRCPECGVKSDVKSDEIGLHD